MQPTNTFGQPLSQASGSPIPTAPTADTSTSSSLPVVNPNTANPVTGLQQPPPSTIPTTVTPPTLSGTPAFKPATAPTINDTFNASLASTLKSAQDLAKSAYDTQIANYQSKVDALNKQNDQYDLLSQNALANEGSAVAAETAQKQEALDQEKAAYDENYQANKALTAELDGLLTQSNSIMDGIKSQVGGTIGYVNAAVSKTLAATQARAGVITALMQAHSGLIGAAQSQLSATLNAVSSIYKDQIDYYKTVADFYSGLKKDNITQITALTKDQQTLITKNIADSEAQLKQAQSTADQIQKAMLDPKTALAYNKAGVSLTDTPAQINQKLANYAQSVQNSKAPAPGNTPTGGTFPKGRMASAQYVELSLERAGYVYNSDKSGNVTLTKDGKTLTAPDGHYFVINNATGQVGIIPRTEYTTGKYTLL